DPSQEVSALTAPSAPTGVRAAFASFSNELTISWDPVPGAAGYCVKLVNSFPCGFPTTTATTFVQSISPGFAIDVRVSAVVAAGLAFLEGPESIPIHLVSPPVAPFGIIVVPAGPFGLKVSWQAVPGAASYAIFRGHAGKFDQVGPSTD